LKIHAFSKAFSSGALIATQFDKISWQPLASLREIDQQITAPDYGFFNIVSLVTFEDSLKKEGPSRPCGSFG